MHLVTLRRRSVRLLLPRATDRSARCDRSNHVHATGEELPCAVEGTTNGASWRNAVSGETLPNGYTQATDQILALKDMLRERIGRDPGFGRASVLFERRIPVGSSLPRSDFRVQICDQSGREELLLTPTSARSPRTPLNLAVLREYAIQDRYGEPVDFLAEEGLGSQKYHRSFANAYRATPS